MPSVPVGQTLQEKGTPPLSSRLAYEILKPNDWQQFQRCCTVLFRAELVDPTASEFGRSGQKQGGIDILGRRSHDLSYLVGIQCRLIAEPLEEEAIEKECRAALGLKAKLREIVFATTAPDDTHATNAALKVEELLRSEGHELKVVVYGWNGLKVLIAQHEAAYHAFCPSLATDSGATSPDQYSSQIADQIAKNNEL